MATNLRQPGLLRSLFRRRKAGVEAPQRHIEYETAPYSPLWDGADDQDEDFLASSLPPPPGDSGAAPPAKPPRTRRWWIKRSLQGFAAIFVVLLAWLAITAPLSKSLQPIAPPEITLLSADGAPIARNGAFVQDPVKVSELPPHVVQAFLAIEDRRFYSHWGIDPRGIARAIWSNLTTGRTQGGSTITQQLAKFTFLTPEQSLTRKAREALIALWLEAWLTKDEILERYLSNAYFGDNCYGLRAASLHYFYRQPEKLKPEQAAMLAGLLQAPSRYAPTKNYDLAEKRMRVVMAAMADVGTLTRDQARTLPSPRLDVREMGENLPTGTYFADWALPTVRAQLEDSYSRQTVTTTLDSRLQNAARRAVARAPLGGAEVALVAMKPTGEVVAMIGGKDYEKSPFNRATQARRQPGSTFKLFVYLAALENGWEPDDTISNMPFETGSYRPVNASGSYSESITLEDAFARSSNVAAVRLLNEVGSDKVIDVARRLGVTAPMVEGDPSLALGTSSMTLLELTSAYAGIAGNAFPVKAHPVAEDEPGWFDWLLGSQESLSSGRHEAMERLLRSAINRGTGRAAMLNAPNFGKTGTSQENRDALFVGYANGLVVGVWIGNDDNTPLAGIHGGGLPARIWRDFMREALGEKAPARPAATPTPDPSGPVQPLDLPEMPDIPPVVIGGEGGRVSVDGNGATISTSVGGRPLDVRVDGSGVRVEPGRAAQPSQAPVQQGP